MAVSPYSLFISFRKGRYRMDVIQLLKKDHKMVKAMFEEFENLRGRATQKKSDLVAQITQALTVHAQVEEELVYPAFMENRALTEQVREALEEHHVTKMLLTELEALQPDDERYDAKVKVLCEYLLHHVKEEEKKTFPEAQKRLSAKRLAALGEEVEACRNELLEGREEDEEGDLEDGREQDLDTLEAMEQLEDREDAPRRAQTGKGRRAA